MDIVYNANITHNKGNYMLNEVYKILVKELKTTNITIHHISYMDCYDTYFIQATVDNQKHDFAISAKLMKIDSRTDQNKHITQETTCI